MTENLPHRDDIDLDMMEELEAMFPGKKVKFIGDMPENEVTEEHRELIVGIEAFHNHSLKTGRCVDCGCQMPNFNPEDKSFAIPLDWNYLTEVNKDEPVAWICASCNRVDEEDDAGT